jgi:hypothetical protein
MNFDAYLHFRPQFAEVIDPRHYSMEWLDRQVWEGAVQLWTCDDAALITEIKEYPTGAKDIAVLIAAGNMEKIVGELREAAEEWAVEQGCCGVLIESREGWAKALKPFGYEPHQLTVRKDL